MKQKNKTIILFIVGAFLLITFVLLKRPVESPPSEPLDIPEALAVESPAKIQSSPTIKDTPLLENKDENTFQEHERPLAEVYPTSEQKKRIYEAEEKALSVCMNERGHEYHPNDYLPSEPRGEILKSDAQVIGYGLAQTFFADPNAQDDSANDALLNNMPTEQQQAWMDALAGTLPDMSNIPSEGPWMTLEVPDGTIAWNTESCLATAARAVYGDDLKKAQNNATLNRLTNQIYNMSATDKTFLSAQKKWRECIKSHGHEFRSRTEIIDHLFEFSEKAIDEKSFQARERELATLDDACAEKAGLDQALRTAQRKAEEKIRTESNGEILSLKADLEAAIKRAESFLSFR